MADRLPLAKLSIQNKQPTPPTETTQPIKTKKTCPLKPSKLPHPCSLNVLPSPRDKWSTMTPPLQATVMGFKGMPISYVHFYFHNGCKLLTHTYATSPAATTVGDGGKCKVALNSMTSQVTTAVCLMRTVVYLHTLYLDLIMEAWTQEAKNTSNANMSLSTCSLPTFPPSPTSTRQFTMRLQTINKPLLMHLPAVPSSFLVQMPSPHQSSNECVELMIPSKKMADHAEISHSSNYASCHSPRLPSTHTIYGQP
jgi:hypothetical protein